MSDSDTDTISVLLRVLWRRRLTVAGILALSMVCGGALAWLKTPVYRASVLLAPRQSEEQSGTLAAVLGQMGGLASLAGIAGLGGGDSNDSIALLKSRALFESFARERHLLPVLFPNQWDSKARSWRSTLSAEEVPTLDDAWEMYNTSIRTVSQDQKSGIVTLAINWTGRSEAADWANDLVHRANEKLRKRAIADSLASLSQLQDQLDKTSVVELRQSIYRLMEMQIKKEVLAKSRPDYAFSVIDPAVVPDVDRFVSPKRALIMVSALLLGIFVATVFVVFDEARRQQVRGRNA